MKRREFIKKSSLGLAGLVTWGMFPSLARASTFPNDTRVLFINLNGGLDGLYSMPPINGAVHSQLLNFRPTLCKDPATLLSLNSDFGFSPLLTTFKSLYDANEFAAVLNVGVQNMSRSHLDAEVALSRGVADRLAGTASGFFSRLGSYYGLSDAKAIMSVTGTDLAFEGDTYQGIQVRGLDNFYFLTPTSQWSELDHLKGSIYNLASDDSPTSGLSQANFTNDNYILAIDNTDIIHTAVQNASSPNAYPDNQFGRALGDIDVLFSDSTINTQIGYMRGIGFDTHSNQEPVLNGLLTQFNSALLAFVNNMKAKNIWNKLIIVTLSEFGRTTKENGSAGTDHGGANAVFLCGGRVNGGQIHGNLTASDITANPWLPVKYNLVEIYRRILMRMDLDPDPILVNPGGLTLTNLFK